MAENSKIEWTDHTFNHIRGCTKVSPGCANCYAESLSKRNPGTLGIWGPNGTRVVASEAMWREPLKWNETASNGQQIAESFPAMHSHVRPCVFCASLADVFEDWEKPMFGSRGKPLVHFGDGWAEERTEQYESCSGVTMDDVRRRLFALIDATPNLDWLVLTKRPENIQRMWPAYFPGGYLPEAGEMNQEGPRPNVWLGTSIENQEAADKRIPELLNCRDLSPVLFLSCEPLLGPVDLSLIQRSDGWIVDALRGVYSRHHDEGVDHPAALEEHGGGPRINWVIVGGESGPNARPMQIDWVLSIAEQCKASSVPLFVKQDHGPRSGMQGRLPKQLWDLKEFPQCHATI
jgi:protein gp37